jgi:predicted metal-dependent hydrolase
VFVSCYVQLFQGVPLLVQLFLAYYGLGLFGINTSPWVAAGMGLTLYASAFLTEIWRGSVESIPRGQWEASQSLALNFAEQRRDWLAAQLARIPPPVRIEPGCTLTYRGETLRVVWSESAPRQPVADQGVLVLGGPQAWIEGRLQRWLEAEALRLMQKDLAHYCARAGQAVPRLALSRARRRWGSCSSNGVIRINWRLIMAPDFVRRSVVAHEVAHMTHFDHSPAFHAHLADLFAAPIEPANRWLKVEGRHLYALFG